jgi:hypothetical protein
MVELDGFDDLLFDERELAGWDETIDLKDRAVTLCKNGFGFWVDGQPVRGCLEMASMLVNQL